VNARGELNWTPLHCASRNGHIKVAQLLLEQKADITAESQDNDTPLFLASREGHFEVVELLLAHGADVNARGQWNWTPLHCASRNGHIKVAQLLLEHKADITAEVRRQQHSPVLGFARGTLRGRGAAPCSRGRRERTGSIQLDAITLRISQWPYQGCAASPRTESRHNCRSQRQRHSPVLGFARGTL
jgi:ankyrin repeat protein